MIRSILVMLALAIAGCAANKSTDANASANRSPMYMCPMHHEMTSSQPGKCAKCGMMMAMTQPTTQPADAGQSPPPSQHKH